MKVRQGLFKFISTDADKEQRISYASRRWPALEPLEPSDELTVLFVLAHDRDLDVSTPAARSLLDYPAERALTALGGRLDPLVIKKIISLFKDSEAIVIMAATNPCIDDETLKEIASTGPEEAVVLLGEDTARLRKKPFLVDAIFKNPLTPGSLMAELREIENNLHNAHGEDEEHENVTRRELIEEHNTDEHNIYQMIQGLSMGGKIKLALTGNKSARDLLIKDANKLIALSVLKNPRITEEEIIRLTQTKGTPEDLLRQVARSKEWLKSYHVKTGLVTNPKTPLAISVKLLDHLYDADLQKLAKSKNIPSVLASSARRKVDQKLKKGK